MIERAAAEPARHKSDRSAKLASRMNGAARSCEKPAKADLEGAICNHNMGASAGPSQPRRCARRAAGGTAQEHRQDHRDSQECGHHEQRDAGHLVVDAEVDQAEDLESAAS